ncbi:unnamed protein product, partial [Ixodes persulcatus]
LACWQPYDDHEGAHSACSEPAPICRLPRTSIWIGCSARLCMSNVHSTRWGSLSSAYDTWKLSSEHAIRAFSRFMLGMMSNKGRVFRRRRRGILLRPYIFVVPRIKLLQL